MQERGAGMLKIKNCEEDILCVDCKNEECLHHGKAMADCPKYDCDNEPMYDCEHCEFMKKYQEDCRKLYKQKGE